MKNLLDDYLVIIVEKEGEPVALIQRDETDAKEGYSFRFLADSELARKNLDKYLRDHKITGDKSTSNFNLTVNDQLSKTVRDLQTLTSRLMSEYQKDYQHEDL